MSGSAFSFFVIESIMPWTRFSATSGSSPSGIISAMPGMRPIMSFMPILAICSNCLRKSSSVKSPFCELLLLLLHLLLRRSPSGRAATFSTTPIRSPWPRMRWAMRSGTELLEPVELLADADELDRHAGDLLDRQGRAAAGVAVELGQDDAVELERVVERLGDC